MNALQATPFGPTTKTRRINRNPKAAAVGVTDKTGAELATLFSSAVLLLAVYFWYDTLKLAFVPKDSPLSRWLIVAIIVTLIAIGIVWLLKSSFPGGPDLDELAPPPPQSDGMGLREQ